MNEQEFKHYKSMQKGLDIYENETLEQYDKRRIKEMGTTTLKTIPKSVREDLIKEMEERFNNK